MAQFDVYHNPNPSSNKYALYLLNEQNDLFESLATGVVVPLVSEKCMGIPAKRLNPGFNIDGNLVFMSTAEIAGVSHQAVGKYVCTLSLNRNEIVDALDF